jgi:probable DNA metabolism protein
MISLVYDGTFDGFLTAVFEVYEYKYKDAAVVTAKRYQPNIYNTKHDVITNEIKANRVWKGLKQKISAKAASEIYHCFLADVAVETTLLGYIQYAFSSSKTIEWDYTNIHVTQVRDWAHKVHRERHRMEAFIRFQLTKDELYYAVIQPDYNVLPLLETHFKRRYADQKWMIYDVLRKYGIYYDLNEVSVVEMNFSEAANKGKDVSAIYDEEEDLYQSLWQNYFKSVNIVARKNIKLHIQHMPKRYWKHLTEKKPLLR